MTFWEWTRDIALNGVAGGVLGGVVGGIFAWCLLKKTLRSESRAAGMVEMRSAVGALRAAAARSLHDVAVWESRGDFVEGRSERLWDVGMQCHEARALAGRWAPALERDLEAFLGVFPGDDELSAENIEEIGGRLTALLARLLAWSQDPKGYESRTPMDWRDAFRQQRELAPEPDEAPPAT